MTDRPRRTRAGGAKKRPTRYTDAPAGGALRRALNAHRKGDLRAATDAYREALASDPASVDAWTNLGAVYVLRGNGRDARGAYAHACALAARDPRVQRDAGIGLASLGHFTDARRAFDACLALDPSQRGARLALSRVCGEDGDRAEALRHAEAAVRDAPDDPSAWIELHRARFDDARPAAAREAAERAHALAPDDVLARVLLAGALWWEGDAARARAALDGGVAEGLRAMIAHAMSLRGSGTRAFAYKRDAMVHALDGSPREGAVLEFGVRHGVSARVLASRAATVHGFDSFAGLPEAWQGMAPGAFSTEGEAPELPENVVLHVGLFEDTLGPFVSSMSGSPRLVHIDSDLYASARTALDALGPRVAPGCVLLFDEYFGNARWREDEHRAFTEARARFGWETEALSLSWITGQAAFRITGAGR